MEHPNQSQPNPGPGRDGPPCISLHPSVAKPTSSYFSLSAIYRRYSHSIISEYLETDLSEKLRKHLCIPNDVENKSSLKRRPPVDEYSNMEKKTKIDGDSVPDLDYSKEFKVKALATMKDAKQKAQQKALVKSAEGSMSITSFFRKK